VQEREYRHSYEIFRKFLGCCEAALNLAPDEEWNQLIAGYREESIDDFAEGLAELMIEGVKTSYRDLLGETYMDFRAHDTKRFAQFFTPRNVADCMAKMMLGDDDLTRYSPDKPLSIGDPACGSGVMLLAAASFLPRQSIDSGSVYFFGQDLDKTCFDMCALNLRIYRLPGVVVHGDSIRGTTLAVKEIAFPDAEPGSVLRYFQT
jgi:type I restriction-modification system DNA methylase subunit